MNRYLLTIFAVMAFLTAKATDQASAPDASVLLQKADSAYTAESYAEAADLYLQAIHSHGSSPEVLYNLGNCYFRLGENGNAIISYERALRLDPSFDDARNNLEFVNARIPDRAGQRGTFLGNIYDSLAQAARSNTWAWLAFGCFVLTLAGVLLYLFSDVVMVRKTGFFGGIVTIIACMVFVGFAWRSAAKSIADDVAVITAPSTILSTVPRQPRDRSQEAMLLHEGTKMVILDSVSSTAPGDSVPALWYDVQIDNDHRAWINSADVTKI